MTTLLEIYESYENGQLKQMADQIHDYSVEDFVDGLLDDIRNPDVTNTNFEWGFMLLRKFLIVDGERSQ